MFIARNGDLWISYSLSQRLVIYRGGQLLTVPGAPILGEVVDMHPLIREQIERIADEAIRDDGVGMPASILVRGDSTGHFGLLGMRERAERIGARLLVRSREGAGTESR